ncbi:MAG: CHAT domain-containing protein [Polyangiaceae bacterium]|nr:CHAT domain-containing protein [Polyangiaceae bacterium]
MVVSCGATMAGTSIIALAIESARVRLTRLDGSVATTRLEWELEPGWHAKRVPLSSSTGAGPFSLADLRDVLHTCSPQDVEQIGHELERALFGAEDEAGPRQRPFTSRSGEHLRLHLSLDGDAAAIPWEYLKIGGTFLVERGVSVVRWVKSNGPASSVRVNDGIVKVQIVCANPDGTFDAARHLGDIARGLDGTGSTFTLLDRATADELLAALRRGGMDGFHFVGHGHFVADDHASILVQDGHVHADHIAAALAAGRYRFVLLGSCHGGTAGASYQRDKFDGIARRIVASVGIPVVAMQCEVPQEYSTKFATAFYQCLREANGDLERAVHDARRRFVVRGEERIAFGIPVLYAAAPRPEQPAPDAECPFPGIAPFWEKDADLFVGREPELDRLLALIGHEGRLERRILVVHGPSGVGKSSFVQAGMVRRARRGETALGKDPLIVRMRPGKDPVRQVSRAIADAVGMDAGDDRGGGALAERLRRSTRDPLRGVLVVIDQFEELFTQNDAAARTSFDEVLAALLSDSDLRLAIVLCVRADFARRVVTNEMPHMQEHLGRGDESLFRLRRMPGDALTRALEEMAKRANVFFEGGLAIRITQDTLESPAGLPLAANALVELWKRRDARGCLTFSAYNDIGEIAGALAGGADAVIDRMQPEEQAAARLVLQALVRPGRGTEDARRALPLAEARALIDPHKSVLEQLSGSDPRGVAGDPLPLRLIVVDEPDSASSEKEGSVELAHETLIHHWPRLVAWIEEDREALERLDELDIHFAAWSRAKRDESALISEDLVKHLRGGDLGEGPRRRLEARIGARADVASFLARADAASHAKQKRRAYWTFATTVAPWLAMGVALMGNHLSNTEDFIPGWGWGRETKHSPDSASVIVQPYLCTGEPTITDNTDYLPSPPVRRPENAPSCFPGVTLGREITIDLRGDESAGAEIGKLFGRTTRAEAIALNVQMEPSDNVFAVVVRDDLGAEATFFCGDSTPMDDGAETSVPQPGDDLPLKISPASSRRLLRGAFGGVYVISREELASAGLDRKQITYLSVRADKRHTKLDAKGRATLWVSGILLEDPGGDAQCRRSDTETPAAQSGLPE